MTTEQLKERIAKKEQEIAKTEKSFNKCLSESSEEEKSIILRFLETGDRSEYREYLKSQNRWYGGDAWTKANDLYNSRNCLIKYQKQLTDTEAKENTLNEMPEVLKKFGNNLLERWDRYDSWKQEQIKKDYENDSIEYHEKCYNLRKKWGSGWRDFIYLTSEQIHKANVAAVDSLIINLINRTIEIAGKITDCSYLELNQDNQGYSIINGIVIGEKGKAKVESIGAGGYNIQRYHIRVLLKEVK